MRSSGLVIVLGLFGLSAQEQDMVIDVGRFDAANSSPSFGRSRDVRSAYIGDAPENGK